MKNLASILKYCPEGTKLYSPIYGEVTFKGISSINNILCKATRRNGDTITTTFTCLGRFYCDFLDSECMLFPSKDQRNWDAFQIPAKKGDVMMFTDESAVFMIDAIKDGYTSTVAYIAEDSDFELNAKVCSNYIPASEDMKKKLFDAIDEAGYEWDGETLKKKEYQFKPFEKVLVRDNETQKWRCSLYSHFDQESIYHHTTVSGIYNTCIPFKGNEHLLGTIDNPQ